MDRARLEKAMVALQKGDGNALAEVYELTSRGVFTFVLPILRDYQLAEDVMQDTYVTCYKRIADYKPGTNPQNWLLTIAKNEAFSILKKRNREPSYDMLETEPAGESGLYYLGDIDSPTIKLANKVLAEDEFNILMMYAVGGFKHREIAEMLKLPLRTVTWKYSNALKKMKKALQEDEKTYERAKARKLQENE